MILNTSFVGIRISLVKETIAKWIGITYCIVLYKISNQYGVKSVNLKKKKKKR